MARGQAVVHSRQAGRPAYNFRVQWSELQGGRFGCHGALEVNRQLRSQLTEAYLASGTP